MSTRENIRLIARTSYMHLCKFGAEKTFGSEDRAHKCTGGKPRNYHEIVLTQICSQATSGTRRGSFQAENWIKKGWCHVHFCFILQLRTNKGEIRQCSSV